MEIPDSDIEDGLQTAAKLVRAYGEDYWPLFEKLDDELKQRQSRIIRMKELMKNRRRNKTFSNRV